MNLLTRIASCCLMVALTHAAAASTTYTFTTSPMEYELPAHDPQIFSNIFFWTVKARCTVISHAPQNYISFTLLKKTGSVNDIPLNAGDSMSMVFASDESVSITVVSGAKVSIENTGDEPIRFACTMA